MNKVKTTLLGLTLALVTPAVMNGCCDQSQCKPYPYTDPYAGICRNSDAMLRPKYLEMRDNKNQFWENYFRNSQNRDFQDFIEGHTNLTLKQKRKIDATAREVLVQLPEENGTWLPRTVHPVEQQVEVTPTTPWYKNPLNWLNLANITRVCFVLGFGFTSLALAKKAEITKTILQSIRNGFFWSWRRVAEQD